MINICKYVRVTTCALALLAGPAFAQSGNANTNTPPQDPQQPPAQSTTPGTPGADDTAPLPPRFSAGFRVEFFPQRFFDTKNTTINTANPILSSSYFGTSAGSRDAVGLTAEYRLTKRVSVGIDFFLHQAEITQLTQIKSGVQDPNSSYDNRQLTSLTTDTQARYWDVPLVARYYGLHQKNPKGFFWLKDMYVLGGMAYRHVSDIRTGTSTSEPDSSTLYNEIPQAPSHNNLVGAVAGVGYKLFEYGKFKSLVEGRYTRWFGYTFQGPSYKSAENQVEFGLTFTY